MSFFERHNKEDQNKSLDANDWFNKGIKFIVNKEYEKAVEAWDKAIELNPNNVAFYIERGATYMIMEQFEKAIENFNKVISLEPNEGKAYTARGATYAQLGNIEKAVSDLKKGSSLGDKSADEYLKGIENDRKKHRTYSFDMNKNLWKDQKYFYDFLNAVSLLSKATSKEDVDPKEILDTTNMLDDIMQDYENRYGSIDDPIFFWYFATANATFLQFGKQFDELGSARIGYIVNGYKEGLNKHLLYPSYSALMMEAVFENMEQFANDHDKKWIITNRDKFIPISG